VALGNVVLGLASVVLGLRQLSVGARHLSSPSNTTRSQRASRTSGRGSARSSSSTYVRGFEGQHAKTPSGDIRLKTHQIKNLDERIEYLRKLVEQGKRDPVVYEFARRAVNKKCGSNWCVPEKDNLAEIKALFQAIRGNVRYTSDIAGIDSYQAPRHTLKLRTGDCLPEGTQLLRADGLLVAIEDIKVGEVIFDGTGWAKVTNWWDKGIQSTLDLELNNGSVLRCTEGHKLFRVPQQSGRAGGFAQVEEVLASAVRPGNDLLQPRETAFSDTQELSDDEAFLLGAYLAEGSRRRFRVDGALACVGIAGVCNGKGIREKAAKHAKSLGFTVREHEREIYLSDGDAGPGAVAKLFSGCGTTAVHKQLPHTRWSKQTAEKLLEGLSADGGFSTSGKNFVFSTTSKLLAVQYRILQRICGRSTSIKRVTEHGGFGLNPIYRVTVRVDNFSRPWAKVRSISEGDYVPVYDIETDSHRFYLPEQDVIVHNCDDYSVLTCASAATLGLPCRFKVIRTKGSPEWNHIYAQVGHPRRNPKKWISFDASVNMPVGWEAPKAMVDASRIFPT